MSARLPRGYRKYTSYCACLSCRSAVVSRSAVAISGGNWHRNCTAMHLSNRWKNGARLKCGGTRRYLTRAAPRSTIHLWNYNIGSSGSRRRRRRGRSGHGCCYYHLNAANSPLWSQYTRNTIRVRRNSPCGRPSGRSSYNGSRWSEWLLRPRHLRTGNPYHIHSHEN